MTTIPAPTDVVARWLRGPAARILVPRSVRQGIAALVTNPPAVEHLTSRPAVGRPVRLLVDNWYLQNHHGAARGSVGTVVAHSTNSPEDRGVHVDWGFGTPVRCDLEELAPAD